MTSLQTVDEQETRRDVLKISPKTNPSQVNISRNHPHLHLNYEEKPKGSNFDALHRAHTTTCATTEIISTRDSNMRDDGS